ncbi:Uncharacterized protein TCM_006140 [Theobroma cacao]|uniref:Uncharacterized protein n=1 Tax=Theobroma cacao TaxID=3641 RepID=A0A061DY54_THECC|nr:Uncharacterized protein TCM_006140 [Theobroma cacao]
MSSFRVKKNQAAECLANDGVRRHGLNSSACPTFYCSSERLRPGGTGNHAWKPLHCVCFG